MVSLFLLLTLSTNRQLRVCADPNNLPFSNQKGEGFENALAELVARSLGAQLQYTWLPQRRGFVRNTLSAHKCDVMMEVPVGYGRTLTTRPYYRSSYVFVSRRDRHFRLRSLGDRALENLRIGVQVVGDDYANTPPAHALARRGLARNVVGFPVYGDYSQPLPLGRIVEAVMKGEVDVAIVWGPLAGFVVRREKLPLDVVPVVSGADPHLPLQFAMAMGVRKDDAALARELDGVIRRHRREIDALLRQFGVPLVR